MGVLPTAAAILIAALSASPQPGSRLLDVPFVSQTERLCGGAAAAMMLRYWGRDGVRAEDFSALVDESAGGIRQSAIVAAIRANGLAVAKLSTNVNGGDAVAHQIAHGRPVIALIEDRPGTYHYVVIVGWTDSRTIVHDPALTPFRVLERSDFDRRWTAANRWAIVGIGETRGRAVDAPTTNRSTAPHDTPSVDHPCSQLISHGVELARSGKRDDAGRVLEAAVAACPGSASAHVELAGIRFLEGRWEGAATLAARASTLDPRDAHAWRLLASSRFVEGDAAAALVAWNRAGEPRIDLVQVSGLVRTRHRSVEDLTGLASGSMLTPAALARAERRVAELPALAASRVSYRPKSGGSANVEITALERRLRPTLVDLVGGTLRAAIDREVVATASSLARSGEQVRAAWRFWDNRPAVNVAVQTPSLFGVSGLWTIEGGWSRQSYAAENDVIVDERRRASIAFADWLTGDTRIETRAGVDRWAQRSTTASVGASIEQRLFNDHAAVRAEGSIWPAASGAFSAAGIRAAWRAGDRRTVALEGRGGFATASARAPLDLWPGAGTGHARAAWLRAHPLLDDGVVAGPAFGRQIADASAEATRTIWSGRLFALDAAAFVDAARARKTLGGDERIHVDVGGGVRLRPLGGVGAVTVNVARGLRDGSTAISAGWAAAWPGW
jgi:predicted double-glycine peptidase